MYCIAEASVQARRWHISLGGGKPPKSPLFISRVLPTDPVMKRLLPRFCIRLMASAPVILQNSLDTAAAQNDRSLSIAMAFLTKGADACRQWLLGLLLLSSLFILFSYQPELLYSVSDIFVLGDEVWCHFSGILALGQTGESGEAIEVLIPGEEVYGHSLHSS